MASLLYFLTSTDAQTLIDEFSAFTDEHIIVLLLRLLCQQVGFDYVRLGLARCFTLARGTSPALRAYFLIITGGPDCYDKAIGGALCDIKRTLS